MSPILLSPLCHSEKTREVVVGEVLLPVLWRVIVRARTVDASLEGNFSVVGPWTCPGRG